MNEHVLTVDVYASWGTTAPKYRVYVDDNLLTERDFTWPGHEVFVRENIIVNLAPGRHNLKIEQVNPHGVIRTKNITLNGKPADHVFTIGSGPEVE